MPLKMRVCAQQIGAATIQTDTRRSEHDVQPRYAPRFNHMRLSAWPLMQWRTILRQEFSRPASPCGLRRRARAFCLQCEEVTAIGV